MFDSLMPELLLAATYSQVRRSGRNFEIAPNANSREAEDYRKKGSPRVDSVTGSLCSFQVEKRQDSSSLLCAPAGIWVQVWYSCRFYDPPVIIFANDEGVILEVNLSFMVVHDALEDDQRVFCNFLQNRQHL